MATQLTIVNNVLRRLREDTVTSVADSDYAALIAMFVNDGIDEVTSAYDWSSLKHTIDVDLVDGTRTYDLSALVSGGGNVDNAGRVTNEYSILLFGQNNLPNCWLFLDANDVDYENPLRYMGPQDFEDLYMIDRSQEDINPFYFTLTLRSDGDGYDLTLWPEPDASRRLRIRFWTPQSDLAVDGTDDATNIIVPTKVVEAYAHMRAANERGEEIGEPGNLLERRYEKALREILDSVTKADQRANVYESVRG